MLAQAGARDVLLANSTRRPQRRRLAKLAGWFREVRFSTIADDAEAVGSLASAGQEAGITLPVLLDLDGGMRRTVIPPGQAAVTLYKLIDQLPGVEPAGLHLYDGHLHESDPAERLAKWETMMEELNVVPYGRRGGRASGAGGCWRGHARFPFHARHTAHEECSPGTTLLWDFGYAEKFADLEFQQAAVLLSRVVSKPG